MSHNIVQADAGHAELVAPLFDLYRQFYKRPPDPQTALNFISDRLEQRDSVIFLARDEGGKALGFAQLYPLFSSLGAKKLWLLNDLYVVEQGRKQGVAKALVERSIELGRVTSAGGITLRTAIDNYPAQRLYEQCGFKQDEQFLTYDYSLL